MPTILLVVFVLQLAIHLINSVGAAGINEVLWILYNKLPTPTSASVEKNTQLKREVLRLQKELSSVSAQDDFAKWARLRRQHDKAVAEHDKASAAFQSTRTRFDSFAATTRWLATNGLRLFMQFWFTKTPIFWIPIGWLPAYAEWVLAFPRAPRGSVSIQVWGIACASVIRLVSEAAIAVYKLVNNRRIGEQGQAQAQAFASGKVNRSGAIPAAEMKGL